MYQTLGIYILLILIFIHQSNSHPGIQNTKVGKQNPNDLTATKNRPELITTIEQVQKILERDPNLPRLTRGEITELYEQVTREEYQKSLSAGDLGRANSMRALMLVLPYNTDNNTEENLQELYTRPPVTKVIESYSLPQPKIFHTPSSTPLGKVDIVEVGNLTATTYKPLFRVKVKKPNIGATTYHPRQPIGKVTSSVVTTQPTSTESILNKFHSPKLEKPQLKTSTAQRFSSHYNAKDAEFQRQNPLQKQQIPEFQNIYQTLGNKKSPPQTMLKDYYGSDSAPKPVISSIIHQTPSTVLDFISLNKNVAPRTKPDAYVSFRPLNIGEEIRYKPEIEDYLTRFGIIGGRKKKALINDKKQLEIGNSTTLTTTEVNNQHSSTTQTPLVIPTKNETKNVVELNKPEGFKRRIDNNIYTKSVSENVSKTADDSKENQFKKLMKNLEELQRLKEKLEMKFSKTSNVETLKIGPDPVTADKNSHEKSDVKRQSDITTTEATTTMDLKNDDDADISPAEPTRFNLDLNLVTDKQNKSLALTIENDTVSTTSNSNTDTEESRNGSLADLENSFGGPDPNTDTALPPKKKNGFYFLADWNSFLEVGDGDDQVVVEFSPKVGDPRLFTSVKIP